MSTTPKPTTADAAARASIGAAARELHLPTVRTEAVRLAEIADRERQTHLRYLAEVLAAEVDDRTERRRTRRINDAKFPRLNVWRTSTSTPSPASRPPSSVNWPAGTTWTPATRSCCSVTPAQASPTCS